MQYKIPVHIENEDKIFLNLSLRQMIVIIIFGAIAYSVFKAIAPQLGGGVAAVPSGAIALIGVVIALFKNSEMTFLPFILNLIRFNINKWSRVWGKGIDSYGSIDVGYVKPADMPTEKINISKTSHEAFESVEDKLKSI